MRELIQQLLSALLRSLLGGKPSTPAPEPQPNPEPEPEPPMQPDALILSLWQAHNRERELAGLPPLKLNAKLTRAAQKHSEWQAANNDMDHIGENGSRPADRISKEGYYWRSAGENVAMGYPSVTRVMHGWMTSPGHRDNILGNYTEIGLGYAESRSGAPYWTAVFATPAIAARSLAEMPEVKCSPLTVLLL